jgi:hypothetical protein
MRQLRDGMRLHREGEMIPLAMRKKFLPALFCYVLVGVAASLTLDGKLRAFLWILLAGLAVKSWVGMKRDR